MFFSRMGGGVDWIVVFLGNPGPKYAASRHNVGFMTADLLAEQKGIKLSRLKYRAYTSKCSIAGREVFLMKPQTYMNLSGQSVQPAAAFYKVAPERILVVADDVSLEVGRLRLRAKGSAGGHNGLKDIIARLGTDEFPRLKIGVGSPPSSDWDMADWVLSGFHNQDASVMKESIERAARAVESVIEDGLDRAMNKFN